MSKKTTKQSRATARRKARQRLRAARHTLEIQAGMCGIRNAARMSSERLRSEIAWKRPGGGGRQLAETFKELSQPIDNPFLEFHREEMEKIARAFS